MWMHIFLGLFCFSYAQERVIIEERGNYYHLETYREPYYKPEKPLKKPAKKLYKKAKKKEKYYIAKEKGNIFHRPSCKFAKKIKYKIKFKTRRKAINSSLRPCKVCKP